MRVPFPDVTDKDATFVFLSCYDFIQFTVSKQLGFALSSVFFLLYKPASINAPVGRHSCHTAPWLRKQQISAAMHP
jgi:hypothetical protein